MATVKERILDHLKYFHGKFHAVEMAENIGAKIEYGGFYPTSKYTTRVLNQLCKEGVLFQWILGTGGIHDLTDSAPKWELWYLKKDSDLYERLISNPNRELKGYRFR